MNLEITRKHQTVGVSDEPFLFQVDDAKPTCQNVDSVPLAIFGNANIFWNVWISGNSFGGDALSESGMHGSSMKSGGGDGAGHRGRAIFLQ